MRFAFAFASLFSLELFHSLLYMSAGVFVSSSHQLLHVQTTMSSNVRSSSAASASGLGDSSGGRSAGVRKKQQQRLTTATYKPPYTRPTSSKSPATTISVQTCQGESSRSSAGVLEGTKKQQHSQHTTKEILSSTLLKSLIAKVGKVENTMARVLTELGELKSLVMKGQASSFKVQGSRFELPLTTKIGDLYVSRLSRKFDQEDIQSITREVCAASNAAPFEAQVILSWTKKRIGQIKQDEKRKVLGIRPYEHCASKPTWLLAQNIITSLQAPLSKIGTYKNNLKILRKFANEAKEPRFNFWEKFEEWLITTTQDINDIDDGAEDVLVENESIEILNDDNDHLSYSEDETLSLEKD